NMHSVKNRFLMRIKNATPGLYRRCWLPMTLRDLLVAAGSLIEPQSLLAIWHVANCWRRAWASRREIMRRRRVDDDALLRWFRFEPAAAALATEEATAGGGSLLASDAA